MFHFAKSGSSLFWTHRDGDGTREEPDPDYRWTDAATGIEHTEEPADWSDEVIDCPACEGQGETAVTVGQVSLFDGIPTATYPCLGCRNSDGESTGKVQRWTRANLWRGHDYFYDAFAIREPLAPSSVSRLSQDIMGQHGGPKDFGLSGVNPNRSSIKILRNLASKTSWHGDFAPRAGERRDSGGKGSWKEQQQAMGANKRDVWWISTQPYKEAHFATFLEALVAIPLLAGTSEHGVCSECGAPWARALETGYIKNRPSAGDDPRSRSEDRQAQGSLGGLHGWRGNNLLKATESLGWRPTCGHEASTEPALTLDPFAGSGTVGVVALQYGRSFVGIELNPQYAAMARKRIKKYTIPKEEKHDGGPYPNGA